MNTADVVPWVWVIGVLLLGSSCSEREVLKVSCGKFTERGMGRSHPGLTASDEVEVSRMFFGAGEI